MKNIKELFLNAFVLLIITVFAGGVLGFVNELTKEPIAKQEENEKNAACIAVFEDASRFASMEGFDTEKAAEVLVASGFDSTDIAGVTIAYGQDDAILGCVITVTSHEGYGGDITFMMGIRNDGTVNAMSLLEINETAGLGMKAEEVLVPQIDGDLVEAYEYTKSGAMSDNQIDAITGATVTTSAITDGLNAGLCYFRTLNIGGEANE